MAKMDMAKLHGEVLSGPGGAALKIEYIDFKEFTNPKTDEKQKGIVFGGVATDVLVNPYNPNQGSTPIPDCEGVPWEVQFPVNGSDNAKKVKELNNGFGFEVPLVDGQEEALRFFKDDERTVLPEMHAAGCYVKVSHKAKPEADPSKAITTFYNLVAQAKRTSTSDSDFYKKLKAKLKADAENQEKIPF